MKTQTLHWLWLTLISVAFACILSLSKQDTYNALNYGTIKIQQSRRTPEVLDKTHPRANSVSPDETSSDGFIAEVSKYSKIETCPHTSCITASGTIATKERTVACPRKYPLGVHVYIKGKEYTCEDRTALNYGQRFDIYAGDFLEDYQSALEWGVQKVQVIIK